MNLPNSLVHAAQQFAREQSAELDIREDERLRVKIALEAAFISGCSVTAHFLVSNDGHAVYTPQQVERDVEAAAGQLGLDPSQLLPDSSG
jgi:hypothetical protein